MILTRLGIGAAPALSGDILFIQAAIIHRTGCEEVAHFDGHGVVGEHQTGGGAGDAEDLGYAPVAVGDPNGGIQARVCSGCPVVGVGPQIDHNNAVTGYGHARREAVPFRMRVDVVVGSAGLTFAGQDLQGGDLQIGRDQQVARSGQSAEPFAAVQFGLLAHGGADGGVFGERQSGCAQVSVVGVEEGVPIRHCGTYAATGCEDAGYGFAEG
ncbi:MAG: hypothetical protein WBF05_00895, partial [Anaerolineales bacterium]